MKYKTLLQVSLVALAFIVSSFFYLKYFSQSNSLMTTKKNVSNDNELNSSSGNTVKNISYESNDDNGNNYIIKSEFGNFNINNKDEIFMTVVSAKINLKNGNIIFLDSKKEHNFFLLNFLSLKSIGKP